MGVAARRQVLDLGAGTGQLTCQLVERGLDVVAVEPSAGMRKELSRRLPHVSVLDGRAEDVPLTPGAVDTVLLAQTWHWVDVERAGPEIARVLRPGGNLGLLWNIRDEREDWVAQLGRLMHQGIELDMNSESPDVGGKFAPIVRADFLWEHVLTPAALMDLVASRSYVITLAGDARASLLRRVRELLDSHPAVRGRDEIALPSVTRCSRTRRMGNANDDPPSSAGARFPYAPPEKMRGDAGDKRYGPTG
ncbi:class I SAM-dependent methyltransferase [Cryobacterium serini]|uniref:class I SAM-dependent methyltransferase n=1 Tax=Cryobacterium serini TaxID=1259201 RepID=UPI0018E09884|nr:class I SAM-dependent methyltransferase [Cryobacterium serini]